MCLLLLTKLGGCWVKNSPAWPRGFCRVAVRPQMYRHESWALYGQIFIAFDWFWLSVHDHLPWLPLCFPPFRNYDTQPEVSMSSLWHSKHDKCIDRVWKPSDRPLGRDKFFCLWDEREFLFTCPKDESRFKAVKCNNSSSLIVYHYYAF